MFWLFVGHCRTIFKICRTLFSPVFKMLILHRHSSANRIYRRRMFPLAWTIWVPICLTLLDHRRNLLELIFKVVNFTVHCYKFGGIAVQKFAGAHFTSINSRCRPRYNQGHNLLCGSAPANFTHCSSVLGVRQSRAYIFVDMDRVRNLVPISGTDTITRLSSDFLTRIYPRARRCFVTGEFKIDFFFSCVLFYRA